MKRKANLVVFDLDGTIVESRYSLGSCANRALESEGFPTHEIMRYTNLIGGGLYRTLTNACPMGTPQPVLERLMEKYMVYYEAGCLDATYVYDGIIPLIATLYARGIPMAVISNKREPMVNKILDHFFPTMPFARIRGERDGVALKPDPEAGLSLCRELSIPPEDTVYLGDSGSDMDFARACGFYAVGVSWGYRSAEELRAHGADVIINKPAEFLEMV